MSPIFPVAASFVCHPDHKSVVSLRLSYSIECQLHANVDHFHSLNRSDLVSRVSCAPENALDLFSAVHLFGLEISFSAGPQMFNHFALVIARLGFSFRRVAFLFFLHVPFPAANSLVYCPRVGSTRAQTGEFGARGVGLVEAAEAAREASLCLQPPSQQPS